MLRARRVDGQLDAARVERGAEAVRSQKRIRGAQVPVHLVRKCAGPHGGGGQADEAHAQELLRVVHGVVGRFDRAGGGDERRAILGRRVALGVARASAAAAPRSELAALRAQLEAVKDDEQAVKNLGVEFGTAMCRALLAAERNAHRAAAAPLLGV